MRVRIDGTLNGTVSRPGRKPKPWYRPDNNAWYFRFAGKKHHLGVHGRENAELAQQRFREYFDSLANGASGDVMPPST